MRWSPVREEEEGKRTHVRQPRRGPLDRRRPGRPPAILDLGALLLPALVALHGGPVIVVVADVDPEPCRRPAVLLSTPLPRTRLRALLPPLPLPPFKRPLQPPNLGRQLPHLVPQPVDLLPAPRELGLVGLPRGLELGHDGLLGLEVGLEFLDLGAERGDEVLEGCLVCSERDEAFVSGRAEHAAGKERESNAPFFSSSTS